MTETELEVDPTSRHAPEWSKPKPPPPTDPMALALATAKAAKVKAARKRFVQIVKLLAAGEPITAKLATALNDDLTTLGLVAADVDRFTKMAAEREMLAGLVAAAGDEAELNRAARIAADELEQIEKVRRFELRKIISDANVAVTQAHRSRQRIAVIDATFDRLGDGDQP